MLESEKVEVAFVLVVLVVQSVVEVLELIQIAVLVPPEIVEPVVLEIEVTVGASGGDVVGDVVEVASYEWEGGKYLVESIAFERAVDRKN